MDFGPSNTYEAVGDSTVSSCYGGALVRYRDDDRTVTVVGSTDFMTNGGLLQAGNAALAMNLAGRPSPAGLVRTAAQSKVDHPARATIFDLHPRPT